MTLGAANRPMAGKGVRQIGGGLNKKETFWQRPEREVRYLEGAGDKP